MSDRLPLHATVALLEDTRTTHFESGAPLLLRGGDAGTKVASACSTSASLFTAAGPGT